VRFRGEISLETLKAALRIAKIPIPDEDRKGIHCAAIMEAIGQVDHERVEFIPARFEVDGVRREKVACQKSEQYLTTAERRDSQPMLVAVGREGVQLHALNGPILESARAIGPVIPLALVGADIR